MNATTASATIWQMMKGQISRSMLSIGTFPIEATTKRTAPTGGVLSPILSARTTVMPKCSGWMPSWAAIGARIGVRMMIDAVRSMKQPTMRRRMQTSRRKKYLFVVIPRIVDAMVWGICATVSTQLRMPPTETRRSDTPEMATVFFRASQIFRSVSVLKMNRPTKSA